MTFEPSQHSFASPEEAEEYGFVGLTTTAIGLGAVGVGVAGLVLWWALPTFVVAPAIIKAFKPEWDYKRRVMAGAGITLAGNWVKDLVQDDDGWF